MFIVHVKCADITAIRQVKKIIATIADAQYQRFECAVDGGYTVIFHQYIHDVQ